MSHIIAQRKSLPIVSPSDKGRAIQTVWARPKGRSGLSRSGTIGMGEEGGGQKENVD